MSKVNFFIAGFIALALASCGTAKNAASSAERASVPDWVTGSCAAYPRSEYLTGTGSAADKRAAEIDAINELVAVFGQKVTSAANASHRMESARRAGVAADAEITTLEQDILREVSQDDIIAVEIPEFFESKKEGRWYALAVMSREKGAGIYSSMIEKNEAEVSAIMTQISAEREPNTMLNFSRLDFAEEIARTDEKYLKRLAVLNPSAAKKYDPAHTPAQIHKIKAEMAARIPVCVSVSEESAESADADGRIAKSFQEVMSDSGFCTTLGTNERYVIDCKIHYTRGESADKKTQFCEYAAECALIDTFSGETLIPLSVTGREGSPTYQNAQARARQKISAKVKSDFAREFQKYLGDFSSF